ncbi:hypothetical protein [Cryobacterium ruanii]|uniref:hypothetical protein n=1 Tax=Cryobacterium ruanii TaxID=1259197 RepID=UPI00141AB8B4|nr:hypothetical protein [Cryobacterium ruanii]
MITFIDVNKHKYRAERICKKMQITPSTHHAVISRPPSQRSKTDEETMVKITDV